MSETATPERPRSWWLSLLIVVASLVVAQVAMALAMLVFWFNNVDGIRDLGASAAVGASVILGVIFGGALAVALLSDSGDAPTPAASTASHKRAVPPTSYVELADETWAAVRAEALKGGRRTMAKRMAISPVRFVGFASVCVFATQDWLDVLPNDLVVVLAIITIAVSLTLYVGQGIRTTHRLWRGEVFVVTGVVRESDMPVMDDNNAIAAWASGMTYPSVTLAPAAVELIQRDGSRLRLSKSRPLGIALVDELLPEVRNLDRVTIRCPRKLARRLRLGCGVSLICIGALAEPVPIDELLRRCSPAQD